MLRRPLLQILLVCTLFFTMTMAAACTPATPAPDGQLPPITTNGIQLLANGRAFEVRGVNYIRPTGGDEKNCWMLQFGAVPKCPWNMAPIEADMDRLQRLGVNTVRVFLNYYVFGGARMTNPEYEKTGAMAHLEAFIAAANKRGIYVIPVLLIEYPQDQFAAEYDKNAIELHVRPVVRHLAGRPGILAWDLFNEPDIGSPVDIRCWDWDNAGYAGCFPLAVERQRFLQVIHDEVKRLDPLRLTTISLAFAKSHFEPAEATTRLADLVDVMSFHYYDNEPYNSGRYEAHWYYGKGFPDDLQRAVDELHALKLKKPIVVTEIGFPSGPSATRTVDELHRDLRSARDLLKRNSTAGMVVWSFQQTPEEMLDDVFTR